MNKFDQIVATVGNIKSDLAEAVSSKGVNTPATATFTEIKTNIEKIVGATGGFMPGDIVPGDQITLLPFLIKEVSQIYAQCIIDYKDEFVLVANEVHYYDKTLTTLRKKVTLTGGIDLDNGFAEPVLYDTGEKIIIIGTTYDKSFFISNAETGGNLLKYKPQAVVNSFIVEADGVVVPDAPLKKYDFDGKVVKTYNFSGHTINASGNSDIHKIGNFYHVVYDKYYIQINSANTDEFYMAKAVLLENVSAPQKTLFFDDYFMVFDKASIKYYDYPIGTGSPKLIRSITKASTISRSQLKVRVKNNIIFFTASDSFYRITDDYTAEKINMSDVGVVIGFDYIESTNAYYVWGVNRLICLGHDLIPTWEFVYPKAGGDDSNFKNMIATSDDRLLFTQGACFYKIEKQPQYQIKHNAFNIERK